MYGYWFSQKTLNRVEKNDETLQELRIGGFEGANNDGLYYFSRQDKYDFSKLGASIGENTHLTTLKINIDACTINEHFFQGLKQNSSIHELQLNCQYHSIVGGVVEEILKAYQENNNLTHFTMISCNLGRIGGGQAIANTLRRYTNLTRIFLVDSGITDQMLLQIVDAIRGRPSLERLSLFGNSIGRDGCGTIATLLRDPISNIHTLGLNRNVIDNEGAAALANGLANNTKLRNLRLQNNPIDISVKDVFSKLLCNTTSISNTFSSNHTLETLSLQQRKGGHLASLLKSNRKGTNKSHVAIKKILKYHPTIDMEPFFEWNTEGEGERNLKALPYVVAWFDRAREAVADAEEGGNYNIGGRKLSAIYQFATTMPLLLVPAYQNVKNSKKRKRDVGM